VIATYADKKFTLCSLTPGKMEQQPLNLSFLEGEDVTFSLSGGNGKACIDLTGNYIMPEDDGMDSEDGYGGMLMDADGNIIDEEIDSELEGSQEEADWEEEADQVDETVMAALAKKMEKKSGKITELKSDEEDDNEEEKSDQENEEDDQEDDDSDLGSLNEEEMMEITEKMMEEVAKEQGMTVEELKSQLAELNEDDDEEEEDEEDDEEMEEVEEVEETPAPKSKKGAKPEMNKKEAKTEVKTEAKKEPAKKEQTKTESKAKTLPSGLVIEDIKVGNGPRAKNGKKVSVRYIGKLTNGKIFDSNTKGSPFNFRLGGGEVIKGWDVGVSGMNVGGTRKLTIPPALAYGSKGAPPDIPKNATLEFEVKLLEVKN
jgi:FK506-binding nuclear protein